MLTYEVFLPSSKITGYVNRRLSFYKANYLRARILWRYRDQHMHMICHNMTLQYFALLAPGKLPEHCAQMQSQLYIQYLLSILRNKYNMIFALPLRVIKRLWFVHRVSPFLCCLAAHKIEFPDGLPYKSNFGCFPGGAGGNSRPCLVECFINRYMTPVINTRTWLFFHVCIFLVSWLGFYFLP